MIIVPARSILFPSFKASLIAPLIIMSMSASISSIKIIAMAKIYILLMLAYIDLRPPGLEI
jgi:hypothetical protein